MSRELVTRGRWGFQQRRSIPQAPTKRTGLGLHYGAGPEWLGLDAPRGLQSVHFGRGFAALGYTFVCDLTGTLFYGRPLHLRGAHTYGHNRTWHAVCVPADSNTQPTDALVDSLAWLLRHGVTRGWWDLNMAAHKDLSPTACPGPLDAIIPEVVSLARRTVTPAPSIPAPAKDEHMIKFEDNGNIKVLYEGSGRIVHLGTDEAYQAVNKLENRTDRVISAGRIDGLSKAGFED